MLRRFLSLLLVVALVTGALALADADAGAGPLVTAASAVTSATGATGATGPSAPTPACATTVTTTTTSSGAITVSTGPTGPTGSTGATGTTGASAQAPCWVDVQPYPFGTSGGPVSGQACAPVAGSGVSPDNSCYLVVTSLAFRSWNYGLAATFGGGKNVNNPFAVWHYNGSRWFPDPTFPGRAVCKGDTVLWAGKLDYWLIGTIGPSWPALCRFDGVAYQWEPLPVPSTTLAHVPTDPAQGGAPATGAITSGACYAWNDCWFFGTYGVVVHWDGTSLSDATPGASQTTFTSAVAREDDAGDEAGAAVTLYPGSPSAIPIPQLFSSTGGPFSPLSDFALAAGDDAATDLQAVDVDAGGQGWVAGNPTGFASVLHAETAATNPIQIPTYASAPALWGPALSDPAPLVPFSASGSTDDCSGPPASRFRDTWNAQTPRTPTGTFLWTSISVLPSTGGALAGGTTRPATAGAGRNQDAQAEPVLVRADCDRNTVETVFRVPDATYTPTDSAAAPAVPADREGLVTAVAALATNDAWATTSIGVLTGPGSQASRVDYYEQPHLYQLTDGQAPDAPAGDDNEPPRPLNLQADQPIIVIEPPPPPPPPPAPVTVTKPPKPTKTLRPAVYDVRVTRKGLDLYLSFKLRRATTIGVQALRDGRVVSSTRLEHFSGKKGVLVLKLNRRNWPTGIRFYTNLPKVTLVNPAAKLTGTVKLQAAASAYPGRHVVSVLFQYSPTGKNTWTSIGSAHKSPWTVAFRTTAVPNGLYDLRAVATDNDHGVAASVVVTRRRITNPTAGPTGPTGATG